MIIGRVLIEASLEMCKPCELGGLQAMALSLSESISSEVYAWI